ncbi:MAG: hypothetical protein ACW972_06760 [Promethearchaeota archaeon]|jgi:hypothetical protein
MKILEYDTQIYNLKKCIEDLFSCNELEKLHLQIPKEIKYLEPFEIGKDSSTIFHEKFYNKINLEWPEFLKTYKNLVKHVIKSDPILKNKNMLFQKTPTFRVHLPGNIAVGAFHCDSEFNHPLGEINYLIPITRMFGTNTVWCESEIGLGDFHPIPRIKFGNLFSFNGNQLRHGNLINTTSCTRVSMDFRLISKEDYDKSNKLESITTKTKFEIGKYYEEM